MALVLFFSNPRMAAKVFMFLFKEKYVMIEEKHIDYFSSFLSEENVKQPDI